MRFLFIDECGHVTKLCFLDEGSVDLVRRGEGTIIDTSRWMYIVGVEDWQHIDEN